MKKSLLICGALAAMAVCGGAHAIEVMGTECEQINVGPRGDVIVKCPATDALRTIQAGTPDSKFLSAGVDIDMSTLNEPDMIYVNVIDDPDFCGDKVQYRIMAATPTAEDWWAVEACAE